MLTRSGDEGLLLLFSYRGDDTRVRWFEELGVSLARKGFGLRVHAWDAPSGNSPQNGQLRWGAALGGAGACTGWWRASQMWARGRFSLAMSQQAELVPTNGARDMVRFLRDIGEAAAVADARAPRLVLLWNQFTPAHRALRAHFESRSVPVAFVHDGVLPGTMVIEPVGQMGESVVGRFPVDFAQLAVAEADVDRAQQLLAWGRSRGFTRHSEPADTPALKEIARARAGGKRIVLFCAHNDAQSGNIPDQAPLASWHSPVFRDSLAAINDLATRAARHGWHLVAKAHPNTVRNQGKQFKYLGPDHDSVTMVAEGQLGQLISAADVVATIVSQSAYVALAAGKPVVLLGRLQLNEQGCCYEALEARDVDKAIAEALRGGLTAEMREAFHAHCARLMRYYLYHTSGDTAAFLPGRGVDRAAEDLVYLAGRPEPLEWSGLTVSRGMLPAATRPRRGKQTRHRATNGWLLLVAAMSLVPADCARRLVRVLARSAGWRRTKSV
jgi:hypothetical protein